jgi:hypothetical protein
MSGFRGSRGGGFKTTGSTEPVVLEVPAEVLEPTDEEVSTSEVLKEPEVSPEPVVEQPAEVVAKEADPIIAGPAIAPEPATVIMPGGLTPPPAVETAGEPSGAGNVVNMQGEPLDPDALEPSSQESSTETPAPNDPVVGGNPATTPTAPAVVTVYQTNPAVPDFLNEANKLAIESLDQAMALVQEDKNDLQQVLTAEQAAAQAAAQRSGQSQQRIGALGSLFSAFKGSGNSGSSDLIRKMNAQNEAMSSLRDQKKQIIKTVERLNTLWLSAHGNVDSYNQDVDLANRAYAATSQGRDITQDIEHFARKNNTTPEAILKRVASNEKTPDIKMLREKMAAAWKNPDFVSIRSAYDVAQMSGKGATNDIEAMHRNLKFLKRQGINIDGYKTLPDQLEASLKAAVKTTPAIKDAKSFDLEKALQEKLAAMRSFFTALFSRIGGMFGGGAAKPTAGGMSM